MKTGISPPLSNTHGGAQAAVRNDFPPASPPRAPPPPPAAGIQHVSSSTSPCSNDSSSGITNTTYGKLCCKVNEDACDVGMDRDVIRIGDTSDEDELSLPPLPPRRLVGTTADGYAKRYLDMCTFYHCVEKNN